MVPLPLQVIDSFLLQYNVGDILILVTVLGALGIALRGSVKLLSVHLLTFGALLFMLPASMFDPGAGSLLGAAAMYKVVGLAIAIVAPLLYTVSRY
jgi:uncharacterized membrane protein YvlD (DUF360 family)